MPRLRLNGRALLLPASHNAWHVQQDPSASGSEQLPDEQHRGCSAAGWQDLEPKQASPSTPAAVATAAVAHWDPRPTSFRPWGQADAAKPQSSMGTTTGWLAATEPLRAAPPEPPEVVRRVWRPVARCILPVQPLALGNVAVGLPASCWAQQAPAVQTEHTAAAVALLTALQALISQQPEWAV